MCFAIIKYSFILHNTDAINKEYRAGLNFISGDKKIKYFKWQSANGQQDNRHRGMYKFSAFCCVIKHQITQYI